MEKSPELNLNVPTGYNPIPTGKKMSEDTKRKISESLKKRHMQEKTMKPPKMHNESVIEEVNKKEKEKKKHAQETKKKISESMKKFHSNKKENQNDIVNKLKKIMKHISKTQKR